MWLVWLVRIHSRDFPFSVRKGGIDPADWARAQGLWSKRATDVNGGEGQRSWKINQIANNLSLLFDRSILF